MSNGLIIAIAIVFCAVLFVGCVYFAGKRRDKYYQDYVERKQSKNPMPHAARQNAAFSAKSVRNESPPKRQSDDSYIYGFFGSDAGFSSCSSDSGGSSCSSDSGGSCGCD